MKLRALRSRWWIKSPRVNHAKVAWSLIAHFSFSPSQGGNGRLCERHMQKLGSRTSLRSVGYFPTRSLRRFESSPARSGVPTPGGVRGRTSSQIDRRNLSLFPKQPHRYLSSFDARSAQHLDDPARHRLRNVDNREALLDLNRANHVGVDSCFVRNGAHQITGSDAGLPPHTNVDAYHPGFPLSTSSSTNWVSSPWRATVTFVWRDTVYRPMYFRQSGRHGRDVLFNPLTALRAEDQFQRRCRNRRDIF